MSQRDLEQLQRELDHRAEQPEAFWQAQRRTIRGRLDARCGDGSKLDGSRQRRPTWALRGLAFAALAVVAAAAFLVAPHVGISPEDRDGVASRPAERPLETESHRDPEIDTDTASLLRSVEVTLASDVAAPLSAADVLLAEMETEYALRQTEASR